MKTRLLLLSTIISLSSCQFDSHAQQDEAMWLNAYYGDFCNVHRLVLTRQTEGINDDLLNHFVMAYVSYRIGDKDQTEDLFKDVDSYIEYHLINRE